MTSENPAGRGALAADQVKITSTYPTQPETALPSTKCQFCGAPALVPNRRERRQRRLGDVPWVMQHAVWCRVYGDGQRAGTTPRPNGGAA